MAGRDANDGSGRSGGAVGLQGFNVVAAIRELHGVSVEQLKQRLDERIAMMEEVSLSLRPLHSRPRLMLTCTSKTCPVNGPHRRLQALTQSLRSSVS